MVVAAFALSVVGVAQEPTPSNQAPAIRVQVNQVLVPVIVADRKGHFVTDLKATDFQVFEDGVEQKLVAVNTEKNGASGLFPPEAGSLPSGGSIALSPSAGNAPVRRTYLIVLDTLNSSFADFVQVRDALKKLFKQEEGSDSQYALVTLGKPTRAIQNLTRDPDAILAAIESKDLNKSILTSEHSNLAQQEAELMDILESCPPPSVLPKSGAAEPCPTAENFAEMAAGERDIITRNLINDLRVLTEQLAGMPGKRALVLASDGFNLQPGRDLFELIAAYENDPSVLLHNQNRYLADDMAPIVRLATARNVTFYTLDSRGLYTVPAGGFDSSQRAAVNPTVAATVLPAMESAKETSAWENQDAMSYLAEATGGVFYKNDNDLLKGLRQAFADGRQYYVLAYNPSNRAADGKYRAIRVEVKGKNLVARAKRGYWAPVTATPVNPTVARAEPSALAAPAEEANIPPAASAPPSKPLNPAAPVPAESASRATLTPPSEPLTLAEQLSFVDMPINELVRALPELKRLTPSTSQEPLNSILQRVGANVATLFDRLPNVTSREQVTEQRIGNGILPRQIFQTFRYLAVASRDKTNVGFKEYRADSKGRLVQPRGLSNGYIITQGFVSAPLYFHQLYQAESRFRYLGQEVIQKRLTEVVAFAQRRTVRGREILTVNGTSALALAQGVAWIDSANSQIVRMRKDLLAPPLGIGVDSQTTRIEFIEVRFKSEPLPLWLPREVEVETKFSGVTFRNTHFYSEFKEFTVQTEERQAAPVSQ